MNLEVFRLDTVLELWYIVLPICVFVVFAARYLENILMSLLGFLIGSFFVSPLLIEWMGKVEFLRGMQQKLLENSTAHLIFVLILGVLCGAVLYGLYKIFVFLAGFLAAGALGYYLTRLILQDKELGAIGQFDLKVLVPIGVGLLLGVICGLIAVRKSGQVLAVVSLLVASALLSFSLIGWSYTWMSGSSIGEVSKMFENRAIMFAFVAVWLILFAFSVMLNFRRRAKTTPPENRKTKVNQ
ncbi:MAG: Uncharacterized protein XD58_0692 [Thermotoga sp. 50_1627]|uniref:hypothetical protein n=1 Tax=Pseudothermotoga sp. TaxID=2033661 RepID=UPI00076D4664|nr:MAG: Uncharacterized protein XD45_0874 [Thermotoga sp. 50_64]KUK25317.1 MAG: Uncharacterized protein XD58_0692 [Thermotoga sp. 50_1627]MBC7117000.1 hypothetical protein [Pseudothermotoga sp.]MDK2923030.1 hypothetical protein [Pseudothermotoga sp.]HBT39899.1 hypothetical protein [Pseudothermotoga sp.]